MAECIDLMQRTMIAVSEGRVVLPLRSILVMPRDRGMMGMMPGYLADPECFGVKLVSLIPRNKPPQYSSHLGLVLLFEADHGQPVALLDAAEITAIRTAAASGLATRLLARPEAGDLALLGAGEQARSHLEAMLSVRALRRIRVWPATGTRPERSPRPKPQDTESPLKPHHRARSDCRRRHHLHDDQGARAHITGRLADAGHAPERGRLEYRRGGGNRHAGRRESTILRRPQGVHHP